MTTTPGGTPEPLPDPVRGRPPLFRERLLPGVGTISLGVLAGVFLGAIPWVLDSTMGYVVGAATAAIVIGALVATSPLVVVAPGDPAHGQPASVQAGTATIEIDQLGVPEVLDAAAMRRVMGPDAQPTAYLCHRPWLDRGVRVPVTDPRDPVPYWLIASRHPTALAEALRQGAQAAHSEQTSWPPSS